MKSLLLVITIFLSLYSCLAQPNSDTTKFKIDIPILRDGSPSVFYSIDQELVNRFSLDNLQNGFDSIQIRIWFDHSNYSFQKLIVLKRVKETWTADLYIIEWNVYDYIGTLKITNQGTLSPRNGWNVFISKLFSLQITTLPNMDNIPGLWDDWLDGKSYSFEIATKTQYRFYSYHLPEHFQEFWQAKNVLQILKLIEEELGIK